ncbi:MAG: hypothetical protein AAF628_23770 [Planctomycetota bacterium]
MPLVSSVVNLQALHDASRQQDIEYEMSVQNIGTPGAPILDVLSAVEIPETLDMGNLRFGRSETWEVFGRPAPPPGSSWRRAPKPVMSAWARPARGSWGATSR